MFGIYVLQYKYANMEILNLANVSRKWIYPISQTVNSGLNTGPCCHSDEVQYYEQEPFFHHILH